MKKDEADSQFLMNHKLASHCMRILKQLCSSFFYNLKMANIPKNNSTEWLESENGRLS